MGGISYSEWLHLYVLDRDRRLSDLLSGVSESRRSGRFVSRGGSTGQVRDYLQLSNLISSFFRFLINQ